ncbi:MAG TPA: glycosyltransferase family 39 protein [Thermoleophilaceae bacterium]|nr:glycosyltransferase family 39 protein [Thermoleophilaceae bacterium]
MVRVAREHPLEAVSLALVVLVAAAVRIAYVGDPPVRYDEVFTWQQYAIKGVRHIVTDYTYPNNHILNSLAEHFAWRLFGESETIMRLPALLFGIALVPAAYVVGRLLYDGPAALWAAALVGGSSVLMQYSVNGRGYSMGMVLVMVAIAAAAVTRRRPGWIAWAVLGVSSVLAVYTVPTMVGGVAIAFAWAAFRRDPPWKPLLVTGASSAVVALLLYLPARGDQAWNPPTRWIVRGVGDKASVLDLIWKQWNDALPWPVQVVLAISFFTAVIANRRLSRDSVPFPVVAIAVTAVIALVLPQSPLARTYVYLLPIYLVTAGAGLSLLIRLPLARLPRQVPGQTIAVGVAVAALLALSLSFALRGNERYRLDPPRSEKFAATLVRPNRPMMSTVTTADPLSYYLGGYATGRPAYGRTLLPGHPRKVTVAVATRYLETLPSVMHLLGIKAAPGTKPRLLRDGHWVDFYAVALRP